jgi:ribosomal protein S18 acetylase RimI-like enzyme
MNIRIRQATPSDVANIYSVLHDASLVNDVDAISRIRVCISQSPNTCFVSESDGVVSGAVLSTFNGFHVFLSHFAIRENCRGLGLASALHEKLVSVAKEQNAIGIIADSWLTSAGLYHKLGYRVPGAIFLVRDLSESNQSTS